MRLIDLFEGPIPLVKNSPSKVDTEAELDSKNSKLLNFGAWGNVYSTPGDVETVTKVSNIVDNRWNQDGYYNFINKVRNYKNETHNVYLPQIYDVVRYKSKYTENNPGRPYIVVNLEKLYELSEFTEDEQKLVLQKICGKTFDDPKFRSDFKWEYNHLGGDIPYIIANLLKKTVKKEPYVFKIVDKDLLKALSIVRRLHHKGYNLDFQVVNFMFRRTPYGPQMVLTDPVSYYDKKYVKVVMGKKKTSNVKEAAEPITSDPESYYDAAQKYSSQGKQLGSGYFASAFEKPEDITTVAKVARLNQKSWDEDGYYAYIEKIKNLKGYLYLPQIYSIKRVQPTSKPNTDPDAGVEDPYLIVEIEKLEPTTKLTYEELAFVFSKLVGEEITTIFPSDQYDRNDLAQAHLAQALGCLLDKTITGVRPWMPESVRRGLENLKIVDPELIKVIKILRNLYQQGFSPDVHSGNFMFRRTPYGPQMVLTDPLAFKSADPVKVKMARGDSQ
jgi:hypothetical protein